MDSDALSWPCLNAESQTGAAVKAPTVETRRLSSNSALGTKSAGSLLFLVRKETPVKPLPKMLQGKLQGLLQTVAKC